MDTLSFICDVFVTLRVESKVVAPVIDNVDPRLAEPLKESDPVSPVSDMRAVSLEFSHTKPLPEALVTLFLMAYPVTPPNEDAVPELHDLEDPDGAT
jgi:hypothetical protein